MEGAPALQIDPSASLVSEALSGLTYRVKQDNTVGSEMEEGRYSAVVEALGQALCRLHVCRPSRSEEYDEDHPRARGGMSYRAPGRRRF